MGDYESFFDPVLGKNRAKDIFTGSGLLSINGLLPVAQLLAVASAGSDFNIVSSGATHTFNLPTASALNRGALSSADWNTFNNKLSNISGQSHSILNQLDYASSGHTGFEKSLTFSTGLIRTVDTITTNDSQIVHNNLNGLQGGVAGQYNHLTNAEVGNIHEPVTVSDTVSVDLTLTGQQISADVLPAGVDHDALLNFVANEHIDHSVVNINAGGILSGGGDITTSRTITLNHSDVDHNQTTNTHNLTTDIDHNSLTNTHNLTTDIDHDQLTNYVSNEHIDHSAVQIATTAATSGLTGGGDITATRNLSVDINGTTAETVNDNADKILIWDNTASALKSQTRANFLSGISATPAGNDGEVQFNNSGAFGADSNLFWDNTSKFLKVNEVRFPTNKKAIFGDNLTGEIFSIQTSDDLYIRNKAIDKDIILQSNIGGLNSEFIRLDGSAATVNFFTDKFYIDNTGKAIFGTGLDGEIFVDSNDDFYFKNITQDKDIILKVNKGGIDTEAMRLIGANTSLRVQSDITNINGNLELTREGSNANHKFYSYGIAAQRSLMNFFKYHGTVASPQAVTSGSQIFDFQMKAYDGVLATGQTVTRFISSVDTFTGADDISGYLEFQTRADGVGQVVVPRVRYEGGGLTRFIQTAGCADCATICQEEKDTTPANPTQDTEVKQYMKDDKLIWQFNNGGTVRYFYIDLTQTAAQQVQHTTTAP
jgi:hypothetical protein